MNDSGGAWDMGLPGSDMGVGIGIVSNLPAEKEQICRSHWNERDYEKMTGADSSETGVQVCLS